MAAPSGAPLNYTTSIDAGKTASECVSILAVQGAQEISTTWADGEPVGLKFRINTAFGPMIYSLPINIEGTYRVLAKAVDKGKIPRKFGTEEQAKRVGWRVMKMWLEVQLALVNAGVAEFAQVMLPYMHTDGASSETVWERTQAIHQLAIESS